MIEFANREGYVLEESDFKDNVFSGDSGELSEDELLNVAGGGRISYWNGLWCTFVALLIADKG